MDVRAGGAFEVQIRDQQMHAEAEFGMAAHWAYKQRAGTGQANYPWLTDLLEILDNAQSPEELLEHTRMAMFQDQLLKTILRQPKD